MDHGRVGLFVGVFLLAISIAVPALAEERSPSEERRERRRGVSPALDACAGLKAGDACRFTPPNREEREGLCRERGKRMFCAAAAAPPAGRSAGRGPAVAACAGLEEGSACSFETPRGHQREGACRKKRDVIRCDPARKSRPGRGERSVEPLEDE